MLKRYNVYKQENGRLASSQRDNLLARIFRDGGQRQDTYATRAEACEAADLLCAQYIQQREEFRSLCDRAVKMFYFACPEVRGDGLNENNPVLKWFMDARAALSENIEP